MRKKYRVPKSLKQNIYLIADFPIPGNNIDYFEKSLKYLSFFNFFNHKIKFHLMTAQARASLGLSIIFSIQTGFEHISLCGVDLYNTRHFYDLDLNLQLYYKLYHHKLVLKI